ncbi:MAG: Fic family protein, partial [Lachnospiraceae bacterium]|nr:Fic family protein [Lachnospiraceae bacterium]
SMEVIIHHLAVFVSGLWQIHAFREGNTRTTAVFFIKYLRTLGFDATNDIFAENVWYFRNALVRANYNDLKNGVHETTEYLELFLRNLLLDEKNELHNRSMHISEMFEKADIESSKADIEDVEADIETQKADIRNRLLSFSDAISEKTIHYALELFSKCGKEEYFGRTIVEDITGLKSTRASELIKLLVDSQVIVSVTGHGKGKYRFQ